MPSAKIDILPYFNMAVESFKQALQALASNYGSDITQKAQGLSTQLNKAQSHKKDKIPI